MEWGPTSRLLLRIRSRSCWLEVVAADTRLEWTRLWSCRTHSSATKATRTRNKNINKLTKCNFILFTAIKKCLVVREYFVMQDKKDTLRCKSETIRKQFSSWLTFSPEADEHKDTDVSSEHLLTLTLVPLKTPDYLHFLFSTAVEDGEQLICVKPITS